MTIRNNFEYAMIKSVQYSDELPEARSTEIAVVIPAFNVEKYIVQVLATIPEFIAWIIVVDDCSHDNTAQLVREFKNQRVCLISHEENRGLVELS